MAYTEAELLVKISKLEDDLLRSEQQVAFADRSVTYRSQESIRTTLDYFRSLLTQVRGRSRQYIPAVSKGLS